MACLGGTEKEPRLWHRYYPGERVVAMDGRVCTGKRRANPHTSRRSCAACPAFRGLRWDGTVANGLGTDQMTPIGLSDDEHIRYQAALEAKSYDEDDSLWVAWLIRQERELITNPDGTHRVTVGIGEQGLRKIGDPDAIERYADRQRAYRASHPDTRRYADRPNRAAYMRAYRAKNRNPNDGLPSKQESDEMVQG